MGSKTSSSRVKLNPAMRREASDLLKESAATWDERGGMASPSQYVGMDPRQLEALQMQEANARGGGVSQPWLQEYGKIMGGGYLSGEENPYLKDIVNRSVLEGQVGLANSYAGAGRFGSGAMANAIQDSSQETASRIYGDNYQMERDRMMQALSMGGAAKTMEQMDANQLAAVGGMYQQDEAMRRAEELRKFQEPFTRIEDYQAHLSGNPLMGEVNQTNAAPFDWGGAASTLVQGIVMGSMGGGGMPSTQAPAPAAGAGISGLGASAAGPTSMAGVGGAASGAGSAAASGAAKAGALNAAAGAGGAGWMTALMAI